MSLSYVQDVLSSVSPQGMCLLEGSTQGQMKTTVEKNKRESTNMLITWLHAERYIACTNTHMLQHETPLLVSGSGTNANTFKYKHMDLSSPRDPLGHGRSTVSPLWVVGHWTPRTSLDSQTCGSRSLGGRGGRRVTGTVAVIGRRSGCLLIEPIGREVGARGRAVEGLALAEEGLAGRVVATWVVVRGPEETQE